MAYTELQKYLRISCVYCMQVNAITQAEITAKMYILRVFVVAYNHRYGAPAMHAQLVEDRIVKVRWDADYQIYNNYIMAVAQKLLEIKRIRVLVETEDAAHLHDNISILPELPHTAFSRDMIDRLTTHIHALQLASIELPQQEFAFQDFDQQLDIVDEDIEDADDSENSDNSDDTDVVDDSDYNDSS